MHKIISKKLSSLPDISSNNYKVEEFVISNIIDYTPQCYGCVYLKGNDRFLLIKEDNADVSEFEFLENQKVDEIKAYYGYMPTFLLAKKIIETSRNYISWKNEKTIFTVIQTNGAVNECLLSLNDMTQNNVLMDIFKTIANSKKHFGNLAYFRMIEYFPYKTNNFQTTTLYLIFSYLSSNPKDIMIVLRGNLMHKKHNNAFINIEIGFSYAFSENFDRFEKSFKKQNKIYGAKNQENIVEYAYINSQDKFYIRCANNDTSLEFKKEILDSIRKVILNLKEYSCIEETIMLGRLRQ